MKKVISIVLTLLFVLLAGTLTAQADRGGRGWRGGHGGGHIGLELFLGPGLWWPYPYYPYRQPPVIIQQSPDIYVQPQPEAEEPHYWYYCPEPQGYYPYVKKCPKGWMRVVPPVNPPEEKD